jgi:primosomal protein N' (replication factor Y) (superfamily II helicase)
MAEYLELVFNIPLDQRFTYKNHPDKPADFGFRAEAMLGNRRSVGAVVAVSDTAPSGIDPAKIKTITRRVDETPVFNQGLVDLSRWMGQTYFASEGECLHGMLPGGRRESEFPASGLDEIEMGRSARDLSAEQVRALESIVAEPGKQHYLYGITGSGKTEVFLAAAERCLAKGQSVIYLVPEIALTSQVTEAVQARFGDLAALIHSGLTPSQKLGEWRRILSGEARVVVGARSAVFAPVKSLGLVVIDEEHEGSYKSGSSPRYHARQVAMRRCADSGATLLMGSATPSVEAWSLMESGRFVRHELTRRLAGGAPPEVKVVPMAGEEGCLSRELVSEIRATKEAGRQTILFLNRRGFSYFFHCHSCGYELTCKHCSVALTYHKERGRMICHYCGYQAAPPSVCPECGSLDVGYSGFGTERVEEEVTRLFPGMSVARIDTDTVKKKGELDRLIVDFRAGKIDILLGTQMVAKGLNFPGVRLVGVVMADTALHLPDFRAAERTFALIVQVAGRAGRFFPDGRVLVQSYKPDNPAVSLAAQARLADFYAWELRTREMTGFPPYSRLVRFVFRSREQAACRTAAKKFAQGLAPLFGEADSLGDDAEILGPAECPVAKVAQNYRYHVLARSAAFGPMHRILSEYYRDFRPEGGVYVEVDVDPVSLL